ncbi:uncharacterized protein LOC143878884 [Tasmannia lanceolata]|uniref:uncharacterized protein LOC143878884 n=1 Tax=Tasmannia lanceolata TaxID=3420 RepID=UPI0040630731
MDMSGRVSALGIELLNQSNYKIWRTCMESYLVGEDLWEVVCGNAVVVPEDTQENGDVLKAWRMKNAKAEFLLKRSISHGLFEHVIECKSASEIWITLNELLNKKNMARLQMLENELANTTQGSLSISQFFLKIKNLCSKISLLDPKEPISEARMKWHIIRGLKREYIPYVTSIQGWDRQPSLVEFENLLASQESLARQMAGC